MVFIFAMPGKDRIPPKTELVDGPKPEVKQEPKVEVKPEPKAEVKQEPKAEVKPEPKPEVKPEPRPAEPGSKIDLDRIAQQLTHQMVLNGLFESRKDQPFRKSIKESWIKRIAAFDEPLELKIAHCLAITSFPYGIGEAENEYVKNVRAIFKGDLDSQGRVLASLAQAPDFPKQRLLNEATELNNDKALEKALGEKDLPGLTKLVDEWEMEYLKTTTSAYASKLIRLDDYVKRIKLEKLDEGCKAMTTQLCKVLRENPEQLKALSVTSPVSDALKKERERVKELLEEARHNLKSEVTAKPKPEARTEALEIWPNPTRGDEFNYIKNYKFPGIQGAIAAGMKFRGIQALNRLFEQLKNSKSGKEDAASMERMKAIWKASVVDSNLVIGGSNRKFLEPMLDALEKNNVSEFDRRANCVNALILIQSASQLGIPVDEIRKMDTFAKQINDAKNAADQKEPIEQMQKLYNAK